MIIDRLNDSLNEKGFRRINSNREDIYLFYLVKDLDVYIVSIMHAFDGNEYTVEQYRHILQQMKNNFIHQGISSVHLLSLIYTKAAEKVKQLCLEDGDTHWIIDLNAYQLIIYETQASDFLELYNEIQKLLEEERYLEYAQFSSDSKDFELEAAFHGWNQSRFRPGAKVRWISPLNTLIICVSIAAFLLLHYSGLFGGKSRMMADGALSWIFIKEDKQYYRLLSSMFMHSDWSHLINNMLVLFFVGDNLERAAGKIRYLLIYFGSGIIAGITSISYNMVKDNLVFSIGASGAIFGIVGAMLYILIVNKGHLEDISSRQIILFAAFSLYGGIANAVVDQAAHIGGFVAGLLLAILLYRKPKMNLE
ncbi:MAG: rhomboid family intramembrane serine protease [Clostridiales bacterium]|nr:rhomboid family intramembrane serine protease [Clostridiales bacterium]